MLNTMSVIENLIDGMRFELARPLWEAGMAKAVFEPFFACMLIDLTSHKEVVWHETYRKHTADIVRACMEMGVYSEQLETYWRVPHLTLKEKLVQSTGADEGLLHKVLPVGAFLGYHKIKTQAQAQQKSVEDFVKIHAKEILPHLPAWAEEVVDDKLLAQLSVDNMLLDFLSERMTPAPVMEMPNLDFLTSPHAVHQAHEMVDEEDEQDSEAYEDEYEDDEEEDEYDEDDEERSISPLVLGGGVLAVLSLLGAGGYWYMTQNTSSAPVQAPPAVVAPAVVAQNRPAPMLSISVDAQGDLYACHARLGNNAQSDELIKVLRLNFGHTTCVIDISEQVSQSMAGFDKLTGVIAVLRTAPDVTFEMAGNEAFINAPNLEDVERLVRDVGALMGDVKVAPMSPLDAHQVINDSLTRASNALNALLDGVNPHELAYALSLQKIDTIHSDIPDINKAVLALSAGKIASNPNAKFIIVVHSDDTGNRPIARMHTQQLADKIRAELIKQGADGNQLVARGVGFDFPISDNYSEVGRFKNRRVEFVVYDNAIMQALAPSVQPTIPVPTYAVVDGQIVEQGQAQPLPEQIVPPIAHEVVRPSDIAPPISAEPVIINGEVPMVDPANKEYVPLPPPAESSTVVILPASESPIPDEVLRPIGSDSAGGVQSVQIIDVE